MNFWGWVLFSFNGRVSRKYYWYTILLFLVVEAVYMAIFIGGNAQAYMSGDVSVLSPIAIILGIPLLVAAIWIGLAVVIKRWHDRGKSGWWVLIGLIPIIGGIWVLIECGFLPGKEGVNQYGVTNQMPTDPYTQTGSPPPLPADSPDSSTSANDSPPSA